MEYLFDVNTHNHTRMYLKKRQSRNYFNSKKKIKNNRFPKLLKKKQQLTILTLTTLKSTKKHGANI